VLNYEKNTQQNVLKAQKNVLNTPPLDTLAQLTYNSTTKNLTKRARSKYLSNSLALKLTSTNGKLKKSYWNTYHCCENLTQIDQKLTGKYCNNRWCLTCNRIRTAKLINGYKKTLSNLKNKRFVTLTVPNCSAADLPKTLDLMNKTLREISKKLTQKREPLIGIRKTEVTYNAMKDNFHPHFHFIISGKKVADNVIDEWLKRLPLTNLKAQDNRPANEDSYLELFKYFTKLISNKKFHPEALNTIFEAMYGKRTFQPMGIKKHVSEDVDEIQSIIYEDLIPAEKNWTWTECDWIDQETGEMLTGYIPELEISQLSE
jgi:hypothetical protein